MTNAVVPVCSFFASCLQDLIQLLHHHRCVDLGAFSKHFGFLLNGRNGEKKQTKLKIKNTNNVLNKLLEASFSFYSHWFVKLARQLHVDFITVITINEHVGTETQTS